MSNKRTYSQFAQVTQSQDPNDPLLYLADTDMPSRSQQRRNVSKVSKRMLIRAPRVPRAIRTRGTPDGYYEIPVTIYRRLYFNNSAGLFNTDPATGVSSGSGYNGFSLSTAFDTSNMFIGNAGALAFNNAITVPGFNNLQGVFDEGKIVKIMYEFWVASQANDLHGTLWQAPNIWIARDYNEGNPPSSYTDLLQYSDVKCLKGDINHSLKMTLYPKFRSTGGTASDEAGTSTTLTTSESPTYMQLSKPGVVHFGLRGWFETNAALATPQIGYLCIKETQIRRYKTNK